jgi:Protein of unknown function (DUF1360)
MMQSIPFHFVLVTLAVWRITHLLSKEDGPFDSIYRVRRQLGHGFFGNLLDCFYCLSIWIAVPFAFWIGESAKEIFLYWLSLSGAACLLEKISTKEMPSSTAFYEEDKEEKSNEP